MDADVWAMISEQSLPVLGICYGMQEMAHVNGGRVAPGQKREYGKAMVTRAPVRLFSIVSLHSTFKEVSRKPGVA